MTVVTGIVVFGAEWTRSGWIIAGQTNSTVGLILCAEKDEVVAKFWVLEGSRPLFASKYMRYLPTEEELRLEIEREPRCCLPIS